MVRRLAAPVRARRRHGAARGSRGARRPGQAHRRRHAGGPAAIVDNRTIPDICLQHLVAMMIVDGGATFDSVHDVARMSDPKVLAIRKLVEAVPNQELVKAVPARQAIVKIDTADGRTLSHRTYEVRGTPGNPMSAEEVAAKALDLMAPILGDGRAKELIAAVYALDSFGPVSGLRRLLQA